RRPGSGHRRSRTRCTPGWNRRRSRLWPQRRTSLPGPVASAAPPPATVLQQPAHSTRESRRPEVQALENQVGGTVTLDDPVQDPVHLAADITAKLLDVPPVFPREARPPPHALQVGGTGGDPPIQLREVRHEIPPQEVTPVRREERPQPEVQRDLLRGGLIGLTLPLVAVGDILRQPEDQSPVLPLGDLDRVPEGALPLKGIAVR